MKVHFNILIDASGSMGLPKTQKGEVDNTFLLPDGKTTRTEVVKRVLENTIIPKLIFVDTLRIETFSSHLVNQLGKAQLKGNNINNSVPKSITIFEDNYNSESISSAIRKIQIPTSGGTPLSWATSRIIDQSRQDKINIIILSDGDDNSVKNFDETIIKKIDKKACKIYFIGISQNEEAQRKSKNLAYKTNGFYVNIEAMNYDEVVFNNMLFEFSTTITSDALKHSLKVETFQKVEPFANNIAKKVEQNVIAAQEAQTITLADKRTEIIEPIDLNSQVKENTKSLKIITSQLDSIVQQISYIGKEISVEKDDFEANEDEERNRLIGNKCEKHLNTIFLKNNWDKVNWLNELEEQSKPYDFQVTVKGVDYYVECKGSTSRANEFFLTKNEWLFYLSNRKNYRLYYVSEINSQNPIVFRIEDLIKDLEDGKLIPCSNLNRKVKADRILFQIIDL